MKKLFVAFLPIILVPMVGACQDKEHSVIAIKTFDDEYSFVELSVDNVKTLINSGQHFILECYTEYCSHCKDLEPLLRKYSKENNNVIYRLNLGNFDSETSFKEALTDPYPNIFMNAYVPQILYIKNKELTYEVSDTKFSSYTALNKIMNKHVLSSNITMIGSMSALKTYENNNSNYVAFVYDLGMAKSLELASSNLITSEMASGKKNIVLLNYASFAENSAELMAYYESDFEHFACYKNGNKIKTIDYTNDDGSQLRELISNL